MRRWLRRIGVALAVLVALLLLLLAGAYRYLKSPAGAVLVRDQVLGAVRGALVGSVDVKELTLDVDHLVLRGLTLRDPEGELVAEIALVEARIALPPLLRRELALQQARVEKPRFYLKQDERGFNLTRALKARQPAPPPPEKDQSSPLLVTLDGLTLEDGYASYVQEEEDAPPRELVISSITGKGNGSYDHGHARLRAELALTGAAEKPTAGTVAIGIRGALDQWKGETKVTVDAPGLKLDAVGKMDGAAAQRVELHALELDPATGRALLPSYPLKLPASASGALGRKNDLVDAALSLRAGSAELSVDGSVDLRRLRTDGLSVQARGINLEELIEKGPHSALSLELQARGGGMTLDGLDGEVHLTVPASRVEGQTLGPVRVAATARDGHFKVSELVAAMPGVLVTGSGEGGRKTFHLSGKLGASDLALFARTLGRLGGTRPPPLSGKGELTFEMNGAFGHPSLKLDGHLLSLAYERYSVKDLQLAAQVPDVRRPLEAQASVKAGFVQLGDRGFRDVSASLATRGRELEADLSARGLADVVVHVGGTIDPNHQGMALAALSFRYSEAEWTLQQPSHVEFSERRLAADTLVLRSGDQLLSLAGSKEGSRLAASVDIDKLDLSLMPRAIVDPRLTMAGTLNARVRVQGTTSQPVVDAHVDVSGGQLKSLTELGLKLDGRYERDRATGKLAVSSRIANLDSDFDVPVQAVIKRQREPVQLTVDVHPFKLEDAMRAAGRKEEVSGTARAQLVVTGTARDPLVRMVVAGRDVRYERHPPLLIDRPSFDLVVESGPEARLQGRLDVEAMGSGGTIALRTPYTAAELTTRLPTLAQLQEAPAELDVFLHDVDARLLHALGVGPEVQGRLTLRAEARGTARSPVLNAELTGVGLTGGKVLPTDGVLTVVAGPERVNAAVDARRNGTRVLQLAAAINLPLGEVIRLERLGSAPLRVDGVVGPIALAELRAVEVNPDDRQAKQPEAVITARVTGSGTLDDPRLQLRSSVDQIRVGTSCVGRADIQYAYAGARSTVQALLTSQGGGRLAVDGDATLDMSYAALRRGIEPKQAPMQAKIAAERFDLSLLTGLIPRVRAISGLLTADARVDGKLGDPRLRGDVEWKDGQLAMVGYGTYKQVHVKLNVTNDRYEVADLSAQSGGGTVKVTATATRVKAKDPGAEAKYALVGRGDFVKFPIVYDDQMRAVLTTETTLDGELSAKRWEIQNLNIPEAHVELPEIQRKDLQELERPEDIVLVKNGKPIVQRVKKPEPPPPLPIKAAASEPGPGIGASAPVAEATSSSARQYWVTVRAPRNIWVRGADVNGEAGLSEGFKIEYQERTNIFGDVRVLRGRVDVLGRRFDVQRDSEVKFTGPASRPYINVTAIHTNERENVTVYVTVRGQGKEVTLRPTSEPPLPESEIYTLLATGRRTLKRDSGASMTGNDAASIAGSLLAQQFKKTIASKLPLDVLSIEAGESGVADARLEAGLYLNDRLYLGYTGKRGANPAKENTHAVRAEYQLFPRVSVEAEFGDARVGGADLIWSRDY